MLDNFTVGQRFLLAKEIGISEDSPDLEKFAEYLRKKDSDIKFNLSTDSYEEYCEYDHFSSWAEISTGY